MKKLFIGGIALALLSGCSISLSGNPDQEKFDQEYTGTPDFSEQEVKVLNGEKVSDNISVTTGDTSLNIDDDKGISVNAEGNAVKISDDGIEISTGNSDPLLKMFR